MKYKSTCCICLRETIETNDICTLDHIKSQQGFISVTIRTNLQMRCLNFCPICVKKSITVEDLKTIGNFTGWSY